MVEAAGIEPASQSLLTASVYVCSPLFDSRPPAACGRAAFGPALEVSRRVAQVRGFPTSPLFTFPPGHGHSERKRLSIYLGSESKIVGK